MGVSGLRFAFGFRVNGSRHIWSSENQVHMRYLAGSSSHKDDFTLCASKQGLGTLAQVVVVVAIMKP